MKNWLNKWNVLLSGLILMTAVITNGEEFHYDYHKSIDIKQPILVNLGLVKGCVSVVGSDEQQIVIEATKLVRASSIDEADEMSAHIEIKVPNVDIQTELDSPTEFLVETTSGNINFAVPFTATDSIELATETGQFSSQMPVEINSLVRNRIVVHSAAEERKCV